MNPVLTTITPVWGRHEIYPIWKKAVEGSTVRGVQHLVIIADDRPLPESTVNFAFVKLKDRKSHSLGLYHNVGARLCHSEWIMKLDVDAIPNEAFFKTLIALIVHAPKRKWFNCGMFFLNPLATRKYLTQEKVPVSMRDHSEILDGINALAVKSRRPDASNFICRQEDYLKLGGCSDDFQGYGWEDYQQTFMLEKFERGEDPLPGEININNITGRCRDEICRRKAAELFAYNKALVLHHHFHPRSNDLRYRSPHLMSRNRRVLFDYISRNRG